MITMEKIDQFRKRTNCSYEEAKMYLERNNGDLVEAMVDFERNHSKIKFENNGSKLKEFFSKSFNTRVLVQNNGDTVLNLSVLFIALFILFTIKVFHVIAFSFVIALLLGYRFSIKKHTGSDIDVQSLFKNMNKQQHENAYTQNESPEEQDPDEYTVE